MNTKRKIVLFDFDGVIVDTFDLSYAIAKKMMPQIYPTPNDYRKSFEGNIYDHVKIVTTDDFDNHHDEWFSQYSPQVVKQPVIEGMRKALEDLSKKYLMVIVSSSLDTPIKEYCRNHKIYDLFDEIFGAEIHLSKVEKIKMVFKKYSAKPADCLFITDTLGDIKEAGKTKVKSLAVMWGFHDIITLKKGKPVDFVEKPKDLKKKIDNYFNQ